MTLSFEDLISVEDLTDRYDALTEELDALKEAKEGAENELDSALDSAPKDEERIETSRAAVRKCDAELMEWHDDNDEEYNQLVSLLKELRGNGGDHQYKGDWYPATLIRDSYFRTYAQELVEDIGDLPRGLPSYIKVDWQATARNIQRDYSSVEIDGVTYWYR